MSDDGTVSFGRQLLRQRRRAGLTQERLAHLAGVGLRTLRDIEAGATTYPQEETARRLCEALRLPPDEHATLLAMLRATPRRRPPRHPSVPPPLRAPVVLPLPLTAMIGREREIETLTQLLRQAHNGAATRLLTVTGPGGVGKTRLVLEVASRLRDAFADGVALVELASLSDAALVVSTLAHTLGLRESSQQPLHEALRLHLCAQELLLILDNFEQVAPAAPQLVALLSACPRVTALVTSRASLRVRGEQVFELQPLELPGGAQQAEADTMSHYPAVNLFVQRARAVVPGFRLDATNAPAVAALCRHVDGLPLAIELAAPWVNVLSPTALLARLERGHDAAHLGAESTLELLVDGALDLPARQQGRYQRAADLFTESLALRRDLGDRWGACIALGNLASVALDLGDYERAAILYQESLDLSRSLGDTGSTANTLAGLALVAQYQADYGRMAALSEESVALARKLGDKTSLAYALSNLALARHLCGEETDAGALFRESLDLYWPMGNKVGVATCLDGLASVAVSLEQAEQAARLLSATATLRAEIGSPVRLSAQERHERCVATVCSARSRRPGRTSLPTRPARG